MAASGSCRVFLLPDAFALTRPVKPAALAATRLAEHGARGLDITGPFCIDSPAPVGRGTGGRGAGRGILPMAAQRLDPVAPGRKPPVRTALLLFASSDLRVTGGSAGALTVRRGQRVDP
jgi:hypothetical protein